MNAVIQANPPVSYTCNIPLLDGSLLSLTVETGKSIIIVGANGSGKTRLGAYLETQLPADAVQRIAAQKSLSLNDKISLLSYERAERALRIGLPDGQIANRFHIRWGGNPAVSLLNDFDALLQTLFAEQNATAVKHLHDRKANPSTPIPSTRLAELKEIWDHLLPHRKLEIREASIAVTPTSMQVAYPGSEMSDGERGIFYFLGQCLVAPKGGVIIIDEPETHVHKAILGRLWDAAESARPDCAFVYMTHDLDFAADHVASLKYFIRANAAGGTGQWHIEELPEDTGLPEHVVAELVGNRRTILFVEGERASLDLTIYRNVYRDFTVVPVGSCEHVIHSVRSYKNSNTLHRLGAVRGLIDADDRSAQETAHLRSLDIYVLPVAEVENLLALPAIFVCLAEALMCSHPADRLAALQSDIMSRAQKEIELVCSRYAVRRLDSVLKRVSVAAQNLSALRMKLFAELTNVDPVPIFQSGEAILKAAIRAADLPGVLALYDNKGYVLSCVANRLGLAKSSELVDKLTRLVGEKESPLRDVLINSLPSIPV